MAGEDDLNDGLEYKFEASKDEGVSINNETNVKSDNEEPIKKEEKKEQKSNKRKNDDKEKFKEKKKRRLEYDTAEKKKIATQTPDIIAEKLAQKVQRQNKKLSALELNDLYINKNNITFTGDWEKERTLRNLPKFLEKFVEDDVLSKSPKRLRADAKRAGKKDVEPEKKKGKPTRQEHCYALILSMSAIRACDVHRATRSMEAGSMKLISKNRLKDDVKNLKTSRCRILAGTPGRIKRILEAEKSPINGTEIKAVICDCYLDSKMQNLWDTPDTIRTLRKIIDDNKDVRVYLY